MDDENDIIKKFIDHFLLDKNLTANNAWALLQL